MGGAGNIWKKYYKSQEKSGWCGPAVIQMVLLRSGIDKSQGEIAKAVYKKWYDTIDVHDRTWIEGWMLWVDLKSKI